MFGSSCDTCSLASKLNIDLLLVCSFSYIAYTLLDYIVFLLLSWSALSVLIYTARAPMSWTAHFTRLGITSIYRASS